MRIRKFRKEDAQKASNLMKKNFLGVNSKEYPKKTINALMAKWVLKLARVNGKDLLNIDSFLCLT